MNRTASWLVVPMSGLVVALSGCGDGGGVHLLADAMAGDSLRIAEGSGTATVWVSSEDGSDPRPNGEADPSLCTVTGGGSSHLEKPDAGTTTLGETTLYAVAQIEDLEPPALLSCASPGFKHVYVGTD